MTTLAIDILYATPIVVGDRSFNDGIGGIENVLILGARALAAAGHTVTVYAARTWVHDVRGVAWRPLDDRDPSQQTDVVMALRCPEQLVCADGASLRVVMLCDRHCPGLRQGLAQRTVDLVFAASWFHRDIVARTENVTPDARWQVVPYSTDLAAYTGSKITKRRGRCLYASAPYRGLVHLLDMWPAIKARAPHAHLFVSSSYLLWGASADENLARNAIIYKHLADLAKLDVTNVVSLPRADFVRLQLESELLLYPTDYDETFCITAYEACAAGAVPITTHRGALSERIVDDITGLLISGTPSDLTYRSHFVDAAVDLLANPDRRTRMTMAAQRLVQGYDYAQVAAAWAAQFHRYLLVNGRRSSCINP